jgi:Phospholipase_D-nuclease N-terminal
MTVRRRWSELSERNRTLIIFAGVIEGVLKIAALADIKRRPASQVRGSKWVWAAVVVVVNSFGGAPLAYFVFGRRS